MRVNVALQKYIIHKNACNEVIHFTKIKHWFGKIGLTIGRGSVLYTNGRKNEKQ
jgi:hypothetical protein